MKTAVIPETLIRKLVCEAEREYPFECCGVILGSQNRPGTFSRIKPLRNAQDDGVVREGMDFSRTRRTAYCADPSDLLALHKEIRKSGESIRMIYHSHIEADPVFSEEDRRFSCPGGKPAHPGAGHVILSVINGGVRKIRFYYWDPRSERFTACKNN